MRVCSTIRISIKQVSFWLRKLRHFLISLSLHFRVLPWGTEKCIKPYQETQKVLPFLKRYFLKIFLIHRCRIAFCYWNINSLKINILSFSLILLLSLLLLLLFNMLFYHRNVNSFLIYFIIIFLLHVCMAEEPPPNGELCNKVQCMYVCTCTSNWFF